MMRMSCSSSQGPNQPRAPKSSTKINPAITGEMAKGRSMSVISRFLPFELEPGDGPGAATPKTVFSGTAIAAAISVRRIAARASGWVKEAK
jgi:hypothetical protein